MKDGEGNMRGFEERGKRVEVRESCKYYKVEGGVGGRGFLRFEGFFLKSVLS